MSEDKRKFNFEEEERAFLLELIKQYPVISIGKSDAQTNLKKKSSWLKFLQEFNNHYPLKQRTIKQLKDLLINNRY